MASERKKVATKIRAFTLIEVMVVVGITSVLAAILFPVFNSAREAAKQTSCLGNVRNITVAYLLYAPDYDDTACPPVLFQNLDIFPWTGWFGQLTSPTEPVDISKGLLAPYLKDTRVVDCPSIDKITNHTSLDRSYGLNDQLCVTTINLNTFDPTFHTVSLSEVQIPTETIMFADCAQNVSGPDLVTRAILQFNPSFSNGKSRGFIHARHNGNAAVVSWLDGHAGVKHLTYNTRNDSTQYTAAWEQKVGIGALLKYPQQYAGATGTAPSIRDMYYYLPDKSVDKTSGHNTLADWLLL